MEQIRTRPDFLFQRRCSGAGWRQARSGTAGRKDWGGPDTAWGHLDKVHTGGGLGWDKARGSDRCIRLSLDKVGPVPGWVSS